MFNYLNRITFIRSNRLVISSLFIALIFIGCGGKGLEELSDSATTIKSSTLIFGSVYNKDEDHVGRNVQISVNPGFAKTVSDDNGNFFFDDLAKGSYTIIASSGNYVTSTHISTVSTDFLSVDLNFGNDSRNANDINFFENNSLLTKKIADDSTLPVYNSLLSFLPINFSYIDSIDWSPVTENLILLSASTLPQSDPNSRLDIYLFNITTKELKLLVQDTINNNSASDPSFSPTGTKFAYLLDKRIFHASITNLVTNPVELIRNQSLLFRTPNGHLFLKQDYLNEEAGLVYVDTQKPATTVPTVGNLHKTYPTINRPESAVFFNRLNTYFNGLCQQNLNNFAFCQDVTIQTCNAATPITDHTLPPLTCPTFYPQDLSVSGQVNASTLFDATNFPADCPVEFKKPVWSPKGNSIAFLAKPKGCTGARPTVCGRTCDDTNLEVFVSFIDYQRDNIADQTNYYSTNDFEQLDKFSVMQITQNSLEEDNISWDPLGHTVLYDQISVFNNISTYFLIASSPSERGLFSRTLLLNGKLPHQATVSYDGAKIAYISNNITAENSFGFPQVFVGDFKGTVSNAKPTTKYNTTKDLRRPLFYKIFPDAYSQ
ncbi:MAG: hypothetical protein KC646_08735 [Candidatus Cloacimonetes bacterium]|nr:hypothetical protein [Candidatus Cloacimonadota bacterium]